MTTIYALYQAVSDPYGKTESKYLLRPEGGELTTPAVFTSLNVALAEGKNKPLFGDLILVAVKPNQVVFYDFNGSTPHLLGTHYPTLP